jgi:PilZ domain-containing protein
VHLVAQTQPVRAAPGAIDLMRDLRRRSPRITIDAAISARRPGEFTCRVLAHDVSMGGCRVELPEECAVGDHWIARFPRLEALSARVRWTDGRTAGLQFVSGLKQAAFEALLDRLGDAVGTLTPGS